jgi:hypothetical protein
MLIKVMHKNNEYAMVKPFLLDELIASGKITKFLRSDRWVTIGIDDIRVSDYRYKGTERRKNSFVKLLNGVVTSLSKRNIEGLFLISRNKTQSVLSVGDVMLRVTLILKD